MDTKIEATVEISIEELTEIIRKQFQYGDLADFELVSLTDKTKTRVEPGMDPHDADYYEDFDGLRLKFKKKV